MLNVDGKIMSNIPSMNTDISSHFSILVFIPPLLHFFASLKVMIMVFMLVNANFILNLFSFSSFGVHEKVFEFPPAQIKWHSL
jgi:hypothetical protein